MSIDWGNTFRYSQLGEWLNSIFHPNRQSDRVENGEDNPYNPYDPLPDLPPDTPPPETPPDTPPPEEDPEKPSVWSSLLPFLLLFMFAGNGASGGMGGMSMMLPLLMMMQGGDKN